MTSFLEIQFPADISYGSSGGPEFSTDITELDSGKEQRNINWSTSRARYNASHGIKLDEQLTELISFFRIVKGRAFGFRFKDWLDYKAENQIIGTGDNSKTEFQLKKKYIFETYEVERDIKKPVDGTVKLYLNASLQSSGFSIDYTSGLITFDTAPSPELKSHLSQEITSLATCWKITRKDNSVKAFTNLDKDIEFESVVYTSITGFNPTSIETKDNLSVDNLDVDGVLNNDFITAPDLLAG